MADTKISGLSALGTAAATDIIPVVRSAANGSVTPADIAAYLATVQAIRSTGAAFDIQLRSSEVLTANRTLSFNVADGNRTLTIPATGTVALIGISNTFTQPNTFSGNSGASIPLLPLTGTWFTGGSATTTKPHFLIEPTGTTSTGWSTSGTGFGINAVTGFVGNLIDAQLNGASKFAVASTGRILIQGTTINDALQVGGTTNQTIRVSSNNLGEHYQLIGDTTGSGGPAQLKLGAQATVTWQSTNRSDSGSVDTRISKSSAGVIKIDNGSSGAGCLLLNPVAVASLPAAATAGSGALAMVNDATATTPRSTVAGGGANKALVMSDGTNWIIV